MHNALLCHIENPDVFLFVNITFGFCLELASLEFRDKAKQQFEREMHEEKVINHNEDMRMAKQQEKFSYILAMKKKTALELIGYQPRRNRDSGNFVVQPVRNVQIPNLVRSDSIPKPPSKSAAEYDSVEVATTSSCCWQSHGPDNSKLPNVRSGIGLNSQAKPHLMISYQWDSQDLCKKIYERLLSDAYVVWFDVVNMHGCIYTAMAEAVETSEIILCGMTQNYKKLAATAAPINKELDQSEPDNDQWKKQYFLHRESSHILAEIEGEKHACINSSVSPNIDSGVLIISNISAIVDDIVQKQIKLITSREQATIQAIIQQRQLIVKRILTEGKYNINQYEAQYRQLHDAFIAKLELEMCIHLDNLQQQIDKNQNNVFSSAHNSITTTTAQAQKAKEQFLKMIQKQADLKIQALLAKSRKVSMDKMQKPIAREELRIINLRAYSTTGVHTTGKGCQNIDDRDRYRQEIKQGIQNHQVKRTVYLDKNSRDTLDNQNNLP
ncbi:unnamed protein product [Rotaria socialis]